jgi:anti-sigma-K factor RskA/putative zinc finger protein
VLNHKYFQELAALAALGQLSGTEVKVLEEHIEQCASCRTDRTDFAGIVQDEVPLSGDRHDSASRFRALFGADRGCRKRFIERARAEGIRFSPEVEAKPVRRRVPLITLAPAPASLLVLASLLIVITTWIYRSRVRGGPVMTAESTSEHEVARLAASNTDLRSQVAKIARSELLKGVEIQQLESERRASRERLAAVSHRLERAKEDLLGLEAKLDSAKGQAMEFKSRSQENAQLAGELKNELDRVRASQSASEAASAAKQVHIRELSEKLAAQTVVFERERELLAAGKEIRDLMGARSLHIIDVFDVDGTGRSAKAFGRVFYTEGQSLIFYAFDLTPRRHSRADHAFQAWGYRDPAPQSARSLGIFYADDKTQDRWVLKFDDPEVLAEIDSVFVTVEPPGGSPKPTGQKLLYAYLNGQPNHP